MPVGWDDLTSPLAVSDAARSSGRLVVRAKVKSASILPMRGRRGVRVIVIDPAEPKASLHLYWFYLAHGVLKAAKASVASDAWMLAVGVVVADPKKPARMIHPELFGDVADNRVVRPRYPALGPSGAVLRKAVAVVAARARDASWDPVPEAIVRRERMPAVGPLVARVHGLSAEPPSDEDKRAFLERLAWAETFTRVWDRLAVAQGGRGVVIAPPTANELDAIFTVLAIEPTKDQRLACEEILTDLATGAPMRRLVLGDVGTGKTAVALVAVAVVAASKRQAIILAPTTVLADQYVAAIAPIATSLKLRVVLIAGGQGSEGRAAGQALASGSADVAIGTHALLRDEITCPRLGLVVIDEQQRLGVGQRLRIMQKGAEGPRPHLLTLSATPIPRTLALALRGDIATSVLRELPLGRSRVATAIASPRSDMTSLVRGVREASERGERVFWIVPRVGPDDEEDVSVDDVTTLDSRARDLTRALNDVAVGTLHGGMSVADKRAAMAAFRDGRTSVLVATTVVEVGVDVPAATLMIIEDADRFGLAQLHQLRGRVGRGGRPGLCVLLRSKDIDRDDVGDRADVASLANRRLIEMTKLASGEDVARADLELRGAGDLWGTRQHGANEDLVYVDPTVVHPWLERIEEDARELRRTDPDLRAPEHAALRAALARFRHAIAIRDEAG